MPDVYNTNISTDAAMDNCFAIVPVVHGVAALQQVKLLGAYLTEINLPLAARVLEIGCIARPIIRCLAIWPIRSAKAHAQHCRAVNRAIFEYDLSAICCKPVHQSRKAIRS